VRRGHRPAEYLLGAAAVLLVGQQHGDLSVVMVTAAEERQALDVVPVQVSEQDRPGERLAVQQPGHPADSRSGVEDKRRRRVVMSDGDAGGVTAVAHEVQASRGRRTPGTAEIQPHLLMVATLTNGSHTDFFGMQRSDVGR
jgi:hypothetical protein